MAEQVVDLPALLKIVTDMQAELAAAKATETARAKDLVDVKAKLALLEAEKATNDQWKAAEEERMKAAAVKAVEAYELQEAQKKKEAKEQKKKDKEPKDKKLTKKQLKKAEKEDYRLMGLCEDLKGHDQDGLDRLNYLRSEQQRKMRCEGEDEISEWNDEDEEYFANKLEEINIIREGQAYQKREAAKLAEKKAKKKGAKTKNSSRKTPPGGRNFFGSSPPSASPPPRAPRRKAAAATIVADEPVVAGAPAVSDAAVSEPAVSEPAMEVVAEEINAVRAGKVLVPYCGHCKDIMKVADVCSVCEKGYSCHVCTIEKAGPKYAADIEEHMSFRVCVACSDLRYMTGRKKRAATKPLVATSASDEGADEENDEKHVGDDGSSTSLPRKRKLFADRTDEESSAAATQPNVIFPKTSWPVNPSQSIASEVENVEGNVHGAELTEHEASMRDSIFEIHQNLATGANKLGRFKGEVINQMNEVKERLVILEEDRDTLFDVIDASYAEVLPINQRHKGFCSIVGCVEKLTAAQKKAGVVPDQKHTHSDARYCCPKHRLRIRNWDKIQKAKEKAFLEAPLTQTYTEAKLTQVDTEADSSQDEPEDLVGPQFDADGKLIIPPIEPRLLTGKMSFKRNYLKGKRAGLSQESEEL